MQTFIVCAQASLRILFIDWNTPESGGVLRTGRQAQGSLRNFFCWNTSSESRGGATINKLQKQIYNLPSESSPSIELLFMINAACPTKYLLEGKN
jgi:hypothetical protein